MLLTYIIAAEMYVYYHLSVPTYPHLPKNLGQEGLLTEQGSHPSLFFLLQGKRLACPEVMTVFVWLTGTGGGGRGRGAEGGRDTNTKRIIALIA